MEEAAGLAGGSGWMEGWWMELDEGGGLGLRAGWRRVGWGFWEGGLVDGGLEGGGSDGGLVDGG